MQRAFIVFFIMEFLLLGGCTDQFQRETIPPVAQTTQQTMEPANSSLINEPSSHENTFGEPNGTEVVAIINSTPLWIAPSLEPTPEDPRTVIVYFYSSTCGVCRLIENQTIEMENEYNQTYRWVRINVYEQEGAGLYLEYFNRSGLAEKDRMVPLAYVRNETFVSKRRILENLNAYLGGVQ